MKTKEEVEERLKLAKRVKCLDKDVWFDLCDEFGKPLEHETVRNYLTDDFFIFFNDPQAFSKDEYYSTCKVSHSMGVDADIEVFDVKVERDLLFEKTKPSRPERYASREVNGMDVTDLIEHWDFLSWCEGNILKYLLRNKGEDISDLEKIIDYAGRRIKQLKNK